jgi:lipopolysaccharide transport system ATP-binding protein
MPLSIRVEQLGKEYRIGSVPSATLTLRDLIAKSLKDPLRVFRRKLPSDNNLWALSDVSFDVERGETLGIIGRNGSGKSTLLKILSRITQPTRGSVELFGRVASLLEVGTGFHAELTGRENVFLSGAILGMKRAEIVRRFDEIVAFSEVERFIDTPIKHYSSGMHLRLAFAVAAHLEPEILMVDEVLAVGDAWFQKKCIGKMSDVAGQGRTVLFVSHDLAAVSRLCRRTLHLDHGLLIDSGPSREVIARYLSSSQPGGARRDWAGDPKAPGDEYVRLVSAMILDDKGISSDRFFQDREIVVTISYEIRQPMRSANVGFELITDNGITVLASFDADQPAWGDKPREPGQYECRCAIPAGLLNRGTYYVTLVAGIPKQRLCLSVEQALRFEVAAPLDGNSLLARLGWDRRGVIAPELPWEVRPLPDLSK